jgi:hypothetical protein
LGETIVGKQPGQHVLLGVGDLFAVDVEHRHLVGDVLDHERALAVGREHRGRDLVAHRNGADDFHVGAVDRQHADRLVGAIGDQRQIAGRIDAQPRRLLAAGERGDEFGRLGFEVDDVNLVVRDILERTVVVHDVHRIRHDGDRAGWIDVEIDRRPDHRILQRQIGDDLWIERIGEIDDQHRILAGRRQHDLAGRIPVQLLVVADDHERRRLRGERAAGKHRRGAT